MIQIMTYLMTVLMSITFMQMNHPLAMGIMLLIQTIMVCLLTGMMTKSFWFSYILFLIFLGGMLILFIYVTSLASNEMFNLSTKLIMFIMNMVLIMFIMFIMLDNSMFYMNSNNMEMNVINSNNLFIMENSLSLNKLYNYPSNLMMILLMNYLLITLIAVVKITKLFFGPLRTTI